MSIFQLDDFFSNLFAEIPTAFILINKLAHTASNDEQKCDIGPVCFWSSVFGEDSFSFRSQKSPYLQLFLCRSWKKGRKCVRVYFSFFPRTIGYRETFQRYANLKIFQL